MLQAGCTWLSRLLTINKSAFRVLMEHGYLENITYAHRSYATEYKMLSWLNSSLPCKIYEDRSCYRSEDVKEVRRLPGEMSDGFWSCPPLLHLLSISVLKTINKSYTNLIRRKLFVSSLLVNISIISKRYFEFPFYQQRVTFLLSWVLIPQCEFTVNYLPVIHAAACFAFK